MSKGERMIESETAMRYLRSGLAVLPANKAQKRPCLPQWSEFQTRLPTEEEVRRWFAEPREAQCLVCGKVSGNLEVIDFDNHGELYSKWKDAIPVDLLARLVIEQTQSGGYHVAYRCQDAVCGNIRLAQGERNGKMMTLVETRGEGGLILCAPGDGYSLVQGDYTALPVLTKEERETLLNAAWKMNEKPEPGMPKPIGCPDEHFENRPGDDFNARGDVRAVLQKHGWTSLGVQPDGNEYWRRPARPGAAIRPRSRTACSMYFHRMPRRLNLNMDTHHFMFIPCWNTAETFPLRRPRCFRPDTVR